MKIKKQIDVKDCGPLVIQSLHNHFHSKWVKLNEIKMKVDFGTKGINVNNLIELAKKYGILIEAYDASTESIIESMPRKLMIALVDSKGMNHYVIYKYKNKKFHITDSIDGEYSLSLDEFKKIYKGTTMTIQKSEYIPEEVDVKNPMRYLAKNWNLIIWISCSVIISIIFIFTSSVFMKLILDKVIPGRLTSTLSILCLSFGFLAILRTINKLLKSYLVKKLTLQIEKDLTYTYFRKLNNVNHKHMTKITINDNLRRIGLISHVSGFIANSFFVIFNESIMFIVATSLLIWISPPLFAISFGAAGMLCLVSIGFRLLMRTKYDELITSQMNLFNSMIDSINQTMELKAPRVSSFNKKIFSKNYTSAKNRNYELWSYNAFQDVFENLIEFIIPIVLVFFGVQKIFDNSLSIGSLIMFVSIFNSFLSPIREVCNFFLQLPQMQKNMNLIGFIINLPEEKINENGLTLKNLEYIRLKNFKVGYDKNLIQIDDLTINGNIRLYGQNGTGKSTFLHSIATVLESKGEIFFNSFEKSFYSLNSIRDKVILISPTTYIPNTSILEYATLGNKNGLNTFMNNIDKYNLVGLLKTLDLSLDSPLINNGQNISSGQRQIVTLLRLFAFKYELIILDEAFENIDINKLNGIKKAINDFQNSIFIEVSHSGKYISDGKKVDIEKINTYS